MVELEEWLDRQWVQVVSVKLTQTTNLGLRTVGKCRLRVKHRLETADFLTESCYH